MQLSQHWQKPPVDGVPDGAAVKETFFWSEDEDEYEENDEEKDEGRGEDLSDPKQLIAVGEDNSSLAL